MQPPQPGPGGQPPVQPTYAPPAAYPYPQPYVYYPPRPSSDSKIAIIVIVVVLLVIIIPIVLAAALYFLVSGVIIDGPGPQTMGVSIQQVGANWSVVIQTTPSGKLPTSTYLTIRDTNGVIRLARTAFSTLTFANWVTNHAFYQDANPSVAEIRAGDALLIARATYPTGFQMEISDDVQVLTARTLQ